MQPILLMDIDGVLNPYAAPTCPAGFEELDLGYAERVRVSPGHGAWLRELAERFEPAWASGWGAEANTVLAPLLGLPPWPTVEFPAVPFRPHEKVPAIDDFVGGRAAAWVDDAHTADGWRWANERSHPTLLVACDPAVGLTRRMVDELLEWPETLPPQMA